MYILLYINVFKSNVFLLAPFFIKHLPSHIEVMKGTDVRLDCIVRGLSAPEDEDLVGTQQKLEDQGFEGEFKEIPSSESDSSAEGETGIRDHLEEITNIMS